MKHPLRLILAMMVIFALSCIVLFAFVHWVIAGQPLNAIPWRQVIFQGSVIGSIAGIGIGVMVWFKQR